MKKALDKINDFLWAQILENRVKYIKFQLNDSYLLYLIKVEDYMNNTSIVEKELYKLCTLLKWENYISSYEVNSIGEITNIHLKK